MKMVNTMALFAAVAGLTACSGGGESALPPAPAPETQPAEPPPAAPQSAVPPMPKADITPAPAAAKKPAPKPAKKAAPKPAAPRKEVIPSTEQIISADTIVS